MAILAFFIVLSYLLGLGFGYRLGRLRGIKDAIASQAQEGE
jgi:hypothetical protein